MGKKIVKQGTPWSKTEVQILRKNFRNNSNVFVADILGRTPKAVERKAASLDLHKTVRYLKTIGRK